MGILQKLFFSNPSKETPHSLYKTNDISNYHRDMEFFSIVDDQIQKEAKSRNIDSADFKFIECREIKWHKGYFYRVVYSRDKGDIHHLHERVVFAVYPNDNWENGEKWIITYGC